MKKITTIILGFLFLSQVSFSQESAFGVKGGLNFFTFNQSEASTRTSIHLGGYYNYMISPVFAIQPELIYSLQGANYSVNAGFVGVIEATYKQNYLYLPVMAKYYVTEGLHFHAGPEFGYLISSNNDADVSGGAGLGAYTLPVSKFDFMLGFGAGYELDFGLNFSLRYNLGLSNTVADNPYGGEAKNRGLQISVGYSFLP